MAPRPDERSLPLPEGVCLVHIGPPKTGTTTLQSAFHVGRRALAAQGVQYAGHTRQPVNAVLAVTARPSPTSDDGAPSMRSWGGLVREVRKAAHRRVVISSEFFADADSDAIRKVARDLGPERVHVAVTLRPLARILSSQWQQYVQSGMRVSYESWLKAMFDEPASKLTPTFWLRHRHDRLIQRWADVVGPGNVTVVALDEADHAMVLRVFEQLLGLRVGTLIAQDDLRNRSLTMAEIEVIRAFNIAFREERLGTPLHTKVMRMGAAVYMKSRQPERDEPRIETPRWASDRAAALGREMAETIAASGVRIVGDLGRLGVAPPSAIVGDHGPAVHVSPQVAASAALGIVIASGLARDAARRSGVSRPWPDEIDTPETKFVPTLRMEPPEVFRVSTRSLLGVLARRARGRITWQWYAVRDRVRASAGRGPEGDQRDVHPG